MIEILEELGTLALFSCLIFGLLTIDLIINPKKETKVLEREEKNE